MNIQQSIIKGIRELLYRHDYLVLPKFGGFVLRRHPALFSSSNNTLMPPTKTVGFNIQLKQNDGVLASWLQSELNCSGIIAEQHVLEFSDYCTGLLSNKRRLSIDHLGFFYLDFENNICFEPQQDVNFLSSSFGLTAVSLQEIVPEIIKPEPKKENVFVDRPTPHKNIAGPSISSARKRQKVLMPLIVATFLLSLISLIISQVGVQGELRSAFFGYSSQSKYQPSEYDIFQLKDFKKHDASYVINSEGFAVIELEPDKLIVVNTTSNNKAKTPIKTETTKRKRGFDVVLGCFSVEQNALRFVKSLSRKEISAAISEKNQKGLFTVSVSGFDSKEDALAELEKLKAEYPSAWIKHMP